MKKIKLDDGTLIEYNDVSIIVSQPTGNGIAIDYTHLAELIAVLCGIRDGHIVEQQTEADRQRLTAWNDERPSTRRPSNWNGK